MGRLFIISLLEIFTLISQAKSQEKIRFNFDRLTVVDNSGGRFRVDSTKSEEHSALLDCMSFVHRLYVYEKKSEIYNLYVDTGECEYLAEQYGKCIRKEGSVCIDLDDVFRGSCQCDN